MPMQKQTLLLISFPVLAIAVAALVYVAAPAGKFGAESVTESTAKPLLRGPSATDPVSHIENPVPPAPPTDQTAIPFNGQEPSLQGTVKAVLKTKLTIEVVEQPVDAQGLVTKTYSITAPADAPTVKVGQSITVFVVDAADLKSDPIPAKSIVISQ